LNEKEEKGINFYANLLLYLVKWRRSSWILYKINFIPS